MGWGPPGLVTREAPRAGGRRVGSRRGGREGSSQGGESRSHPAASAVETERPRCGTRPGSEYGREKGFLAKGVGRGVLWLTENDGKLLRGSIRGSVAKQPGRDSCWSPSRELSCYLGSGRG